MKFSNWHALWSINNTSASSVCIRSNSINSNWTTVSLEYI
jgi:hypothetical protein